MTMPMSRTVPPATAIPIRRTSFTNDKRTGRGEFGPYKHAKVLSFL
jgi:hypothetical protein